MRGATSIRGTFWQNPARAHLLRFWALKRTSSIWNPFGGCISGRFGPDLAFRGKEYFLFEICLNVKDSSNLPGATQQYLLFEMVFEMVRGRLVPSGTVHFCFWGCAPLHSSNTRHSGREKQLRSAQFQNIFYLKIHWENTQCWFVIFNFF